MKIDIQIDLSDRVFWIDNSPMGIDEDGDDDELVTKEFDRLMRNIGYNIYLNYLSKDEFDVDHNDLKCAKVRFIDD